jgi:hypothetical protein
MRHAKYLFEARELHLSNCQNSYFYFEIVLKNKKFFSFISKMTPSEIFIPYSPKFLTYSVFQGFSKAKSANGGSILSSSHFLILPQLPQKIKLSFKSGQS